MGITDPRALPKLLDEVHDRWINVDDAEFDKGTSVLRLPLIGTKRRLLFKHPDSSLREGFLEFHHVIRYSIADTEKVGFYDINRITFDSKEKLITVTFGIPLVIQIWVDKFEIHTTGFSQE